jgi:hypothetical protein
MSKKSSRAVTIAVVKAAPMRRIEDLFKALDAETKRIATVAFVALCHPDNMFQAVYLYFLPNKLTFAVLREGETPSPGWELAMPDRLPRNLTEDQIRYRIQTIAQRLPIFPNE